MKSNFEITKEDTPETLRERLSGLADTLFLQLPIGKWSMRIEKQTRTEEQNRRYWGMIIEAFSDFTGYDKQESHQLLAKRFLAYEKKGKSGKVQLFYKSTTQLNTKEFCEYCDQCEKFGNEHGLIFPSLREYEK